MSRMDGTGNRSTHTTIAGAALLLGLLVAAPARSEDLADTASARSIGVEGVKLADAGKCNEAIDKLSRAEKLHHATTILARLGECQVATGRLVEGTENLQRVLREQIPSGAPAAFLKARERAQSILESNKSKIGKIVLTVRAPREATLSIVLDGQPISALVLDSERPTDPGEHYVEVTAPGYLKAGTKFVLAEAEKRNVTLSLEADPNAVSAPVAAETTPTSSPSARPSEQPSVQPSSPGTSAPTSSSGSSHVASYVLWGLGGVGVAVGTGFGLAALGGKSDLDGQCAGKVCTPKSQDTLDSTKSKGTISTIGFGVGIAGLAAGTILYFVSGSSGDGRESAASRGATERVANKGSLRVTPWVDGRSAGLSGTF